jgi:hypothetical protein
MGTYTFTGSGAMSAGPAGRTRRRNVTGDYRSAYAYVFRDGQWQLAASWLTRVPQGRGGVLGS